MNDSERRKRQAFLRSCGFGDAHTSEFAEGSLGRQYFVDLKAVCAELDHLAASEAGAFGSVRQGTFTRQQARDAIIEDLQALRRTARAMADEVPGIESKFRIPYDNNDRNLLNAARAALADATPLKARFIAHEMPADFLEDLAADIAAMEESMSDQASSVGDHVSASAAIDEAIGRGMDLLRKLDAIVRNKYANNAPVLAEWTSASHIERAPKRKKHEEPPATPQA
jgi:hypothetical protein